MTIGREEGKKRGIKLKKWKRARKASTDGKTK